MYPNICFRELGRNYGCGFLLLAPGRSEVSKPKSNFHCFVKASGLVDLEQLPASQKVSLSLALFSDVFG